MEVTVMDRRTMVGGIVVLLGGILPAWSASTLPGGPEGASALRSLIQSRVGSLTSLQVPARNDDLPQPRKADGSIDPRYQITEAKRYLGKLLFFDPVRSSNIRPEFGGILSTSQTASCGSCHLGAAAGKAGTQANFGVGGEGFGFTTPDGHFVPRRRVQAGLVDLMPTDLEKKDAAGNVVVSGRFDAVDSVPRLSPTLIGFAYNNRLLLGGKAGEPYDPANPNKANANPTNLPAGENLDQLAFKAHRMFETQAESLQAVPAFVPLFQHAFPDEANKAQASGKLDDLINNDTTGEAMATFARTVITRNTPWDHFLAGDDSALTDHQMEGARLFFTAATAGGAGCVSCHSGPALNKALGDEAGTGVESNFHNLGIGDHPLQELARKAFGDPNRHDIGRGEVTGNPADNFKFKTPTLRQVKDGRQYTHSGQFDSVRAVVEYVNAGLPADVNAAAAGNVDPLFTNPRGLGQPGGLGLSPDQIDALVDFLENGLYDPAFARFDPTSSTDTFEPNERDLSYSDELHALGAVDGLLPSHMNIGSNDALSRRDRGLEFLDVTDRLTMQMDGSVVPAGNGTMMQRMMLTNQSKDPIDGDLVLVMTQMPAGAVLMNAEGYATHMPGLIGMPYLRVRFMDGQLAAGASMPVDLNLQMAGTVTGGYSLRILSGAGAP
jgi:cytochrome c peroxidase